MVSCTIQGVVLVAMDTGTKWLPWTDPWKTDLRRMEFRFAVNDLLPETVTVLRDGNLSFSSNRRGSEWVKLNLQGNSMWTIVYPVVWYTMIDKRDLFSMWSVVECDLAVYVSNLADCKPVWVAHNHSLCVSLASHDHIRMCSCMFRDTLLVNSLECCSRPTAALHKCNSKTVGRDPIKWQAIQATTQRWSFNLYRFIHLSLRSRGVTLWMG